MGEFPHSVKGTLNFAADRNDGGRFSAFTGDASQNLLPVEVDILNMRSLPQSPTLEAEGFVIASHPVAAPDWKDDAWVASVYVPSCVELVKRLTGAAAALQMYTPIFRTRQPDGRAAVAAGFIHFDQPREQYRGTAEAYAAEQGVKLGRAAIYNVWKSATPPPQDLPLAISDRRTVAAADHVIGVSYGSYGEAAHVKLARSDAQPTWYYVPDLALDESLVFLAADFDPSHPLGCPHAAFSAPPVGGGGYVPRTSIEVRVLACFD